MRVCFALLHQDTTRTDPEAFLERARPLRHLPPEIARLGHEVDVVVSCASARQITLDGVVYHFVPESRVAHRLGQWCGRLAGRPGASLLPATRAIDTIVALEPELIHFHGTNVHLSLALLLRKLGGHRPPIVLQYHGGFPSPHGVVRVVQRRNLGNVDRFLFTTVELARPFVEAGMIAAARVVEFVEASTTFRPATRVGARARTGMHGDPVFLWVGRLDPIKDPFTAIRGFERVLLHWPAARLYLHYLDDRLLPELREFVDAHPRLREAVHFGGSVSFDRMEDVFNSADFLLQSSRREFSGYAVLEALACGVLPVVTDISAFRAMTGDGRHGVLFPTGDDEALARGVIAIRRADLDELGNRASDWFRQRLSFPALAGQLEPIYQAVTQEKAATGGADVAGART